MEQKYQEHKAAFLKVLGDAQVRYRDNVVAGLQSGTELMSVVSDALEKAGTVRLFKYQPFTERNLQDCASGVLHLAKLADLNDINEGWPIFDRSLVEHALGSVNVERVTEIDSASLPPFLKDGLDDDGLRRFAPLLKSMQETGCLENTIAPSVADALLSQFYGRRDFELCGSLSETERSASMWDRYGDSHRGFVAGYTLDTFIADLSTTRTGSCNYGFKTLVAPVFYGERFDLSFNSSIASIRDPTVIGASNVEFLYLMLCLLQKAKEWEYEQEWRVITYACSKESKVFYSRIEPDSIFLGLNMQQDERNRVIELARSRKWRVFEMKVSMKVSIGPWAFTSFPIHRISSRVVRSARVTVCRFDAWYFRDTRLAVYVLCCTVGLL